MILGCLRLRCPSRALALSATLVYTSGRFFFSRSSCLFVFPRCAQSLTRVPCALPGRCPLLSSRRINANPGDFVFERKSLAPFLKYAQCLPLFLAVVRDLLFLAATAIGIWQNVFGPFIRCTSGGLAFSFGWCHHAASARTVFSRLEAEAMVSVTPVWCC